MLNLQSTNLHIRTRFSGGKISSHNPGSTLISTKPTRVRLGQKLSILDYVFTDIENVIDEIRYSDPLGKSDRV